MMVRALLLVVLLAAPAAAQQPVTQQPVTQPPTAVPTTTYDHDRDAPVATARRIEATIRVDGVLDEAVWASATPVTGFTQYDPSEGRPASQGTEIRFLYDDEALYIGARMRDTMPPTARVGRRDMSMSASDWLTVIIDARHDHRSSFGFEINPAGVRRDQTRAAGSEDDSWDPVWQAATTQDDTGWVAELRIPFSQLRFSGEPVQRWGLQIERQIARNQEFASWAFTPRDQPGGAPRYGHLVGLESIATGKRLEVMPYVVSRAEYVDRGRNPFRTNEEYALDAGADLKYRVTSSLTLDATVNPDFGQVEVDPAVINLTAFETQYQEKRPFFVEGSELFRFAEDGTNSLFYSRRIGRRPSLAPPYEARDVPAETNILGAAKLTGRTAGGWATGVLDAVTRREVARYRLDDGTTGESVAEPLTNYFVGRARREMRSGQSAFGGLLGMVHRDLDSDLLASAMRSAAYSGGVDVFHQWDERTFTLRGYLAGSHVRGEPAVIAATQAQSHHYFQRPDAEHLELDPTRTSLTGFAGNVALTKRIGRLWNLYGSVNGISPEYEVNDLGFQRRSDRVDKTVEVSYNDSRPGSILRSNYAGVTALVEHNFNNDNVSNRIFGRYGGQFLNYWGYFSNVTIGLPNTYDDRLTRGGPAARRPGNTTISGGFYSDSRKPIVGEWYSSYRTGGNGSEVVIQPTVEFKPTPKWQLTMSPTWFHLRDEAQYLFTEPDAAATRTYGARYVFAPLDYTEVALVTRLNYTLTPGLSLQVYAQPLIASGDFGAPTELAAPETYAFDPYGGGAGIGEDDFDFRSTSLRGNAVLRWEWRPGSTLYLAWQQTRSGDEGIGDFDFSGGVDRLFRERPDNVLVLKVSYWLNP